MSECNIYKLIEEFISSNSTTDTPAVIKTTTDTVGGSSCNLKQEQEQEQQQLLTPPQSPQPDNKNNNDEEEQQQQIIIEEIKQTDSSNIRPNRPYSYYVATNFHPYDQQQQQTTPTLPPTNLTIDINTSSSSNGVVKKKSNNIKNKNKNRLSVSLTDIKKPANNKMSDNNEKEHLKSFASQNCVLNDENNQTLKLKEQFEVNSGSGKAKMNRLNKLIRRLFTFNRKIKSSSPLSSSTATPITILNKDDVCGDGNDINHIQHINYNNPATGTVDSDNEESKFVRFFTSFRSTNAYNRNANKSSNCTPVVAKKELTPPQSCNVVNTTTASNNLPHLSLLQVNTSYEANKSSNSTASPSSSNDVFYTQVVNKLKRMADDCLNDLSSSTATTTISSENIPFIDDDEQVMTTTKTTTTANTSFSFDTLNSNELTFSRNKLSSSTKYDLTEDLVKKLANEIDSYSTFDSIVNQVSLQNNIDWYQIAIVFELISRAVKHAGNNDELANKIKKTAVEYIDVRYRDWILKQEGGWMSVPESKTGSFKFIGEMHNFNY